MAKHDYLFVDESGDPGFKIDMSANHILSSPYYTAAVLHIVDDAFRDINRHIANFRFYTMLNKDLKIPPKERSFRALIEPIGVLAENQNGIYASAVYLNKRLYTGRYLKPGGERPQDPIRFRNFVLRCLLEHHFQRYSLQSDRYDLVLDRFDMAAEARDNLEWYLSRNPNIPTPSYITHASSIYVEGLQIAHHIANGYKDAASGGEAPEALSFVSARNITTNQRMARTKGMG